MSERGLDVLDKYDVTVQRTAKVRGALMFETDKGAFLLKEFKGAESRIGMEAGILDALAEKICVETYIRNAEGGLVTESEEGIKYIVKTWHEGRECNVRDIKEVCLAVRMLGWLHLELNELEDKGIFESNIYNAGYSDNCDSKKECADISIPDDRENDKNSYLENPNSLNNNTTEVRAVQPREGLSDLFWRHNRELKRVRTYIKGRKSKNSFERLIMDSFDMFNTQAVQALEIAQNAEPVIPVRWCHGQFSHHHIVLGTRVNVITEFSHMHKGIQMDDLYYFARKVLEKNRWDLKLGKAIFDAYNSVRNISQEEWDYLYLMFLYPEKYWKQLNYYFNSNKVWIPEKNIDKLKSVINQQTAREVFIGSLKCRTSFAG